jgi:hypothetical protein
MWTSTTEKSIIDILKAANGPRLRSRADGTIGLLGAKCNRTKDAALSVKNKETTTERRASYHLSIVGHV